MDMMSLLLMLGDDEEEPTPEPEPTVPSTYLRHSSRHAHQSIIDHIKLHLEALDWTVPGSVPFGAPIVTVLDGFPDEWDEDSLLEPGTVVITLGDEDAAREEELGPLTSIELPCFFDCYMDTDSVALALSLDIRDILTGRMVNTKTSLNVSNYNETVPAESGYNLEFEDVIRSRIRNKWHVVKATATMLFNDVRADPVIEESS